METDKATVSFDATDDGFLAKILIPDGGEADVNQPVAVAAESKEDVPKFSNYKAEKPAAAAVAAAPKPASVAQPAAAPSAATTTTAAAAASASSDSRIIASPLAKKLAERAGISLKGVAGTGPNNRITKADVDAILAARNAGTLGLIISYSLPSSSARVCPRSRCPGADV